MHTYARKWRIVNPTKRAKLTYAYGFFRLLSLLFLHWHSLDDFLVGPGTQALFYGQLRSSRRNETK